MSRAATALEGIYLFHLDSMTEYLTIFTIYIYEYLTIFTIYIYLIFCIGSESDLTFDGRAAGTVFDGKRASATGLSLVSGQRSLSAASGRQMKSSSASSSSLSSFSSMLGDRAVRRSSTAGLENEHTAAAAAAQRPSKARNIHRHSSSVM